MDFIFLLLLLGLIFIPSFLMMRRQRKQQADLQAMQAALAPGDRVVTSAGLHGTISHLTDATAVIEVAPGVELTFERIAILRSVPAQRPEPFIADDVQDPTFQGNPGADDRGDLPGSADEHPENFR